MAETKSVFISYSSKDADIVREVVQELKDADIDYWKAPEMIPAGSNYAREIPKAIAECTAFVLIISDDSQNSIWVEKEVDCAINNRKTIVPIKISKGKLTDMFSFYLNNVQTIYYYDDKLIAMQQLLDRVQSLIQEPQYKSESSRNIRIENHGADKEIVEGHRKIRTMDSLLNPQPAECRYCGGELENISRGIYKCLKCGRENYDYFRTVRNYLEEKGPCTIMVIERATGIPRSSIEYFLREEMLEIPKGSSIQLVCSRCGASIRTGTLCDLCKRKGAFSSGFTFKRRL